MQCTHTGTHTRVCSVSWPAFEALCHFNCPHHVLIANCAVVLWRNRVVIRHYLLFVCVCGGGCMECRIASKFTNKCHRIHKCILRFTYKCQAILKRFIYRLPNVHLETARHFVNIPAYICGFLFELSWRGHSLQPNSHQFQPAYSSST